MNVRGTTTAGLLIANYPTLAWRRGDEHGYGGRERLLPATLFVIVSRYGIAWVQGNPGKSYLEPQPRVPQPTAQIHGCQ